jgi:hypothetical protein
MKKKLPSNILLFIVMTKEKTFRLLPCRTEADIRSWLSLSPPAMNKVLELEGFGVTNSLLGAPNSSIVSVLQQMVQQRPVGSSGGVSLSVTEAGNVIALLNRRVESAREGLNTVQVDVLLQNCEVLKDMLSSCEICQIFSPTSTVLGELQDTKAGQELRAIKTAFERGRDVMQVFYL